MYPTRDLYVALERDNAFTPSFLCHPSTLDKPNITFSLFSMNPSQHVTCDLMNDCAGMRSFMRVTRPTAEKQSTLLEPAACTIHGLDKLNAPVGVEVLLIGAGPTGLIFAQLLNLKGMSKVTLAANKGIKMDIAKQLDAAPEYVELGRQNLEHQWAKLKEDNPYGFDVVVEATGVEKIANEATNYIRQGGTLMIYGVYENKALVHWPPRRFLAMR